MCYEFDELYKKMREEDAQRQKAKDGKDESRAPAKPAAPAKPREPVPA